MDDARIIVDVMGSDRGPQEIIKGVVYALEEGIIPHAICIGDKDIITRYLANFSTSISQRIDILHAPDEILMDEKPAAAMKSKKHASIIEALKLVRDDERACIISAGNTGAIVFAAVTILDKIERILKPALAVYIPTKNGVGILLDVGASVDCKPKHLYQFGVLGKIYAKYLLKKDNPRIGLLNIGEESIKGNKVILETYELFVKSGLNFVGNVEGKDIVNNKVDVAVCDGFIGNIALKFAEGIAETILSFFKSEIEKSSIRKIGALFLRDSFTKLKRVLDYTEYGGAPLLGVRGYCIICHGRSNAKAIKHAILQGKRLVTSNINYRIRNEIK